MNIQFAQQMIEENIFERKKETIYNHNFSKADIEKFDLIFDSMLGPELEKIIQLQDTYSHGMKYAIKTDTVKLFIEQLYINNFFSKNKQNRPSAIYYL